MSKYRDGKLHPPARIGSPPSGQCEHWYLVVNCPYCALADTRSRLAEVADLLRASERDVAKLTGKVVDAEIRIRALTHQVSMLKVWRERTDKADRIATMRKQMNVLRCKLARRDEEILLLRGRRGSM